MTDQVKFQHLTKKISRLVTDGSQTLQTSDKRQKQTLTVFDYNLLYSSHNIYVHRKP